MKIGGLQPTTLLDYPGKTAAIIFSSGCNFRCPFCYNFKLVLPEKITESSLIPEADIFDFLTRRKKYLDGVVITGGEPTVQLDLVDFCRQLKKLGYLVKVDTNGSNPEVISRLLEADLVDYFAMDLKAPLERYQKFTGRPVDVSRIKKSIELIIKSGCSHEFRSTLIKGEGWHQPEDISQMVRLIQGAEKYFLQVFNSFGNQVIDPDFNGQRFTSEEMNQLAEQARRHFKDCRIRG